MLVRMLTDISGAGGLLALGDVVEVDDDFGRLLCSEPADQPRAQPVAIKAVERTETRVVDDPTVGPELPKRRGRPPKIVI